MFESLTQPNYPKAALGLESTGVTALALQKEGKSMYGVRQAAVVELPANLLVPSFTELNISNPDEMAVLIEDAVSKAGLQDQKRWSVSLPSNSARTAILTLENQPNSRQELEEILDWKAENTFGEPASNLRIARQKISSERSGKPRYFATAVKLSVIDEYETIFERFGWQSGLILPRAVSEAKWLMDSNKFGDSLLISSQPDGFTALLLRGSEPTVVRTVSCSRNERDDEVYRLLMFYRDRLSEEANGNSLDKLLLVGKEFTPAKLKEISNEALGKTLSILRPDDIGFSLPVSHVDFNELAAPAGLAKFGWK